MDINEYIKSGKLEAYLLGLLPESEAREVEQVAANHAEIRAELNAMEEALSIYARAQGISMPADLPERILRRLDALGRTPPSGGAASQSNRWTIILGILLLLALLGLAYFWTQTNSLRNDLQQARNDLQILQQDCDELRNSADLMETQLAILRSDNNEVFIMRGTDKAPNAIANVYYNETDQQAYLDVRTLPPPPPGQQYQLWGLVNGTDPVSMNVFDIPTDDSFISVPYVPGASVFAVTLESAGGRPTPTLEQMYLIS